MICRIAVRLSLFVAVLCSARSVDAIVISEIHYNPLGVLETLEFVEISNESTTPEDVSGYHFLDGIAYTIPTGTILGKHESIVICADVAAVRDHYDIDNAIGNYQGRLDNNGERLTLVNHVGVIVSSLSYDDDGKWPTAADGSGHTLMLSKLTLDVSEPESWTWSAMSGGSPGTIAPSLPAGEGGDPGDDEVVLIDIGDEWRFARGDAPFSPGATPWTAPAFDDSLWESGPGGFGYADGDDETVLGDMRDSYSSVACRARFTLTAEDVGGSELTLGVVYDDGFCAFVNGVRVAEANCPASVTHDAVATSGHEANAEELFTVPVEVLTAGENVIAIVGYNVSVDSTDFSIATRALLSRRPPPAAGTEILLEVGDEWRFRRGDSPFSGGATPWTDSDFDDTSWESGPSGFGYDDGDDATILDDMRNGYSSLACRATFQAADSDIATATFALSILFDDGFCAWVNGTRFADSNCPASVSNTSLATAGHEASAEESFGIPAGLLVPGENVLAIVGFNVSLDSSDFSLAPRVLVDRPDAPEPRRPLFNELHRDPGAGDSWVELFNPDPVARDISGYSISTTPDGTGAHSLPGGSVIPARGFLAISDAGSGLDLSFPAMRMFLRSPGGRVVAAAAFNRLPPPELEDAAFSEAFHPDGGSSRWITTRATRAAANEVDATTDIVINEIFYHPPEDRGGEFLEILNRGARTIDLSGYSFDRGVSCTIENGTSLGPGEHLLFSEDPDLIEQTHDVNGVIAYVGQLSNAGERVRLVDVWGNVVDEVRYWDGGAWSLQADGRGSSLELIDPSQPNDVASAWAPSDESSKSQWERLSYAVEDYLPAGESELHLLLVGRGACLIDEVSVRRTGGANQIPNGGFESSTSPWRIEGTHIESRRVTYDAFAGGACLELRASGKGDSSVNRVETDTSPRLSRGRHEVSLRARWLWGGSLIVGHGEFAAGSWGGRPGPSTNMSANSLGGRLRMTVPANLGTPGAENSVRTALRESTGDTNLGPVIGQVTHSPAAPDAGARVEISAPVDDSDGVAVVRAHYREGHAGGVFSTVDMNRSSETFLDGVHAYPIYRAQLPGFDRGTKVVFFVEATDTAGASRRFPTDAPDRTMLFHAVGPQDSTHDAVSYVMDDARTSELGSRRLHSNHLLDGVYTFNDEEVHYHVGTRYRGSPWGRPERRNYRYRFPKDRHTHAGLRAVNLSSRVNGPVESASYFFTGRTGTTAKPASVPMYRFVASRFNGTNRGVQRFIQPVDGLYVQQWFPESDGPVLKAVARLRFNDSGSHTGYDGASFDYMSREPENYRYYWYHTTNRNRDDWDSFMELMSVMDPRVTSNSSHDAQIDGILDVEGFLRVMVPRMFVSDWDTLGMGQGHNAYMKLDSRDGLWETVAFDYNQAMPSGQIGFPVFPAFDRGWARLISRPKTRRTYVRIASEMLSGYWSTTTAGPWLSRMESDVGISMNEVRSFVNARSTVIRRAIDEYSDVPFRILTNGGDDFETDQDEVELQGEASAEIAFILVSGAGEQIVPLDPTWETPNRWSATFDVPGVRNEISFIGVDSHGRTVATVSLVITNPSAIGTRFIRGDANRDRSVGIADAVTIVRHLFAGLSISCDDAADMDDSGAIDVSDAISLLDFLYRGGVAPPQPYPVRGPDPTDDDALGCEG